MQTLLITGASGFVGSHVVEACEGTGLGLKALVRRPGDLVRLGAAGVTCVPGSLEDGAALSIAMRSVDVVLHLAAVTSARSQEEYERVNATGTRAVVEAMVAASPRPRRLVYLSSLAAAGPSVDGRPVTVDDPPRPLTAYGRSKLAGETICEDASGDLSVVILRAPAVYGPRDREIYRFFRFAKAGLLPVPSGPARTLQLVHVADLARALVMAATHPGARGLYHIAEGRAYTWEEMAGMIATALGRRARRVRVPPWAMRGAAVLSETAAGAFGRSTLFNREKVRELLAPGWLCETARARNHFGFEAEIPLEEGLKQTAAWYRANGWL